MLACGDNPEGGVSVDTVDNPDQKLAFITIILVCVNEQCHSKSPQCIQMHNSNFSCFYEHINSGLFFGSFTLISSVF